MAYCEVVENILDLQMYKSISTRCAIRAGDLDHIFL